MIPGDVLLSINGQSITSQDALEESLYALNVGDSVEAVIYRSGEQYQLTLTLTEARR